MRRLTSRPWPVRRGLTRRLRDERGAVAVVVALFMVPLLGFGAIAVDIAALRSDQTQLQNGADAAALAIATDCARTACGATVSTAAGFAAANFSGGTAAGLGTPSVSVSTTNRTVGVTTTATRSHWFAPVLGQKSSTVSESSAATWTPATSASTLPFAISWCEYRKQVAAQPLASTSKSAVTLFSAGTSSCTKAGSTVDGGFAWLKTSASSNCTKSSSVGDQIAEAGTVALLLFWKTTPAGCTAANLQALVGTTVLVPIFTTHKTWDQNTGLSGLLDAYYHPSYTVYGYAAFHVTGFASGTSFVDSWGLNLGFISWELDPKLQGYFTTDVELSDSPTPDTSASASTSTAPDLGVSTVSLAADTS